MNKLTLNIENYQINLMVGNYNGKDHIAVKPLCEALGLDTYTQTRKLKVNPQFSCSHMTATGMDGKYYEMICIPVEEVGMFLCTINARRTKEQIRPRLVQFQKHLQIALNDHLTGKVSRDVVVGMEKQIKYLCDLVAGLLKRLEAVEDKQECDHHLTRYMREQEASEAGRRLQSQRRVNLLQ